MAKIGEFDNMKLIHVYQLHSTADQIDQDAFCDAFRGKNVMKAWLKNLYEHRATVMAQDLEEAFEVGNMRHQDLNWQHPKCHSFSVGNIFHNIDDDVMYICEPVGWSKIKMSHAMLSVISKEYFTDTLK